MDYPVDNSIKLNGSVNYSLVITAKISTTSTGNIP